MLAGVLGLACGTEQRALRGSGGSGGSGGQVGQSGGSGGLSGIFPGGSAGVAGSPASGGAGGGPSLSLGEPLQLVAGSGEVPYAIGPNPYGIRGGAFLARAAMGNTITVGNEPGQICISGNLAEVPLGDNGSGNYGQYWGVEFGFNLNQSAPGSGGDAGVDAGADAGAAADAGDAGAGAPAEVARPWQLGNVIGFAFTIEGPTINFIRFKALPAGFDRTQESSVFCKELPAVTSGAQQDALFSEMDQYCWGASFNLALPTGNGLDNIAWQLPADVAVGERPFDWCLKDLRPILAD